MLRRSLLILVTALFMLLSTGMVHAADGDVSFVFDENTGTITFSGTGTIPQDKTNYSGQAAIKSVVVESGITAIGDNAFQNCSNLETVSLPDTVTALGSSSFYNCSKIASMDLPPQLQTIGGFAFRGCNFKAVTIPKSVQSGDGAFNDNTGLESVTFESGMEKIPDGILKGSRVASVAIPSSVTAIGSNAFKNCSFTTIDLPDGLKTIGNSAFAGCSKLTAVEIPDTVTKIENYAFSGNGIRSIFIPKSVTETGFPFNDGNNLEEITFEDGTAKIPDYICQGAKGLKSVHIPDSVKEIGYRSFKQCYALKYIDIPDSVESIGNSAFQGTPLSYIKLPPHLKKIENYAFEGTGITEIAFPDSIELVDSLAFDNLPLERVDCSCDNAAVMKYLFESCARDKGWCYPLYPTDLPDYEPAHLAADVSMYNASTDYQNGFIPMKLEYELKNADNLKNKKIEVIIPKTCNYVEGSLMVNKKAPSGIQSIRDRLLTFNVDEPKGTVSFMLDPKSYGTMDSAARLVYTEGGTTKSDLIGVYHEKRMPLTCFADANINSASFKVQGFAPPQAEVTLSVEGGNTITATASKAGYYKGTLELSEPTNGKKYRVTAQAQSGTETVTSETTVKYDTSEPQLEEFLLDYYGHGTDTYNLLDEVEMRKPIIFNPKSTYRFRVKVSNADQISALEVVSTRNNVRKSMEAHYDASTGYFVAEGWFDENNPGYVPGGLTVEYQKKTAGDVLKDREKLDAELLESYEVFKERQGEITNPTVTTSGDQKILHYTQNGIKRTMTMTQDETTGETTLLMEAEGHEDASIEYKVVQVSGEENAIQFLQENGYTEEGRNFTAPLSDKYKGTPVAKPRSSGGSGSIDAILDQFNGYIDEYGNARLFWDWNGDQIHVLSWDSETRSLTRFSVKSVIKDKLAIKGPEIVQLWLEGDASLKEVGADKLHNMLFDFAWDFGKHTFKAAIDYSKYEIMLSNAKTDEERAYAQEMMGIVSSAYYLRLAGLAFQLGETYFGYIAPFPHLLPLKVCLYLWDDLLTAYETGNYADTLIAKFFLYDPIGRYIYAHWIIDPSGYVYEGTTEERLEGASATVWYKENEDSDPKIWNAEEYDQVNPFITGSDGCYAWNVPEGLWKVAIEKDGYEKWESDWLPVPPEQTDVNANLMSKAAPLVEKAELKDGKVQIDFSMYMDPAGFDSIQILTPSGEAVPCIAEYDQTKTGADRNGEMKPFAKSCTISCSESLDEKDFVLSIPDTVASYAGVKLSDAFSQRFNEGGAGWTNPPDNPDDPDNPDNPDTPDKPDQPSTPTVTKQGAAYTKTFRLVYNGKNRSSNIIVQEKKTNKTLRKGTDYTISSSTDLKSIGKHSYKVVFKGSYKTTPTYKDYFYILPAKAVIKSAKPGKKKLTVKIRAQSGGVKYQVSYRIKGKSWKTKTATKPTLVIKKLKAKKKYQVRVRAFKVVSGTTYSGSWSKVKTVKIK